jgi:Tfp pilus assembly protein FimT
MAAAAQSEKPLRKSRVTIPSEPRDLAVRSTERRGVSLLTILLTLAGVALVAGLAIPLWFARHEVTLDNAALLLVRDLRATQSRAAILGEPMQFELDQHGWQAKLSNGEPVLRAGSDEPLMRRIDADGVFEGVTLSEIQFGADHAVAFGPIGEWKESGSVELHFRGETRRIVVTAPRGDIRIEGLQRSSDRAESDSQ